MATLNWTELEARFRALSASLQPTGWIRLDYQWNTTKDDDHWSIVAYAGPAASAEFDTLCTIAGGLLMALPPAAVAPEALAETNAKHRWYLALWYHMTPKIPDSKSFAGPDDKIGTVFTGHIRQPVELSATLCLQFSTVELPASRLARFKESKVGRFVWKFVWWLGEEPLKKALGALFLAGAVALARWLISR
jgi:hypothetical protein